MTNAMIMRRFDVVVRKRFVISKTRTEVGMVEVGVKGGSTNHLSHA
jgi:hypothetical protein